MKQVYQPVLKAIIAASDTLDASTAALNNIFQFAESYAAKAARIRDKHLEVERTHLATLTTLLNLDSESAADVTCKWMETEAAKSSYRGHHLSQIAEMAFGSIRLLVTDSTLAALFKSAVFGKSEPDPKSN